MTQEEEESHQEASEEYVRRQTMLAYETAVDCAGFVPECHSLWEDYLTFVNNWGAIQSESLLPDSGDPKNLVGSAGMGSVTKHQRMLTLRSIYQRCVHSFI